MVFVVSEVWADVQTSAAKYSQLEPSTALSLVLRLPERLVFWAVSSGRQLTNDTVGIV